MRPDALLTSPAMGGLEFRVNGAVVRRTPFPEGGGEQGVVAGMVEWLRLTSHDVCWLVDLPAAFMELFPGDEVEIDVVSATPEAWAPPQPGAGALRPRGNAAGEAACDVLVDGEHVCRVQSARGVTVNVSWVEPTPEMLGRGVRRSLQLAASATGPEGISYFRLEPGQHVRILLSEVPAAAAESAFGSDLNGIRGVA